MTTGTLSEVGATSAALRAVEPFFMEGPLDA